tara:strand:+ start:2367 stop:2822 length:456 start_codon:yes stop_codon:yes gene_type:complete
MKNSTKAKLQGLTIGVLVAASMSAMAASKNIIDVRDHYREVVYLEPYTVEVCSEQEVVIGNQADIVNGAFWGAIFGAVVGDVIDENGGKVPGAVIGGMLGAKDAEGKLSKGTAMVCKTETRKKSTSVNEYSHSTISFEYDGVVYELDFIKK